MNNFGNAITVSELNRRVRLCLEDGIGIICVEGEISTLSKPTSGHFYFNLKDTSAQIRCVFFRHHQFSHKGSPLQNGQKVQAFGQLSVYEPRGDYQLIISNLTEIGEGDLFRQFEQLKIKLSALGLFDQGRKKSIPKFPQIIGIVTSKTGAALQDILTTIQRRFALAEVRVYPTEVQGKMAATQIIQAINQANKENLCDVIILARGGGSMEDLWAFNDENLAYCIANSGLPIVTGIGHEIDFTIADFAADLRAPTPTAAAESVTPNHLELNAFLKNQQLRLINAVHRILQHKNLLLKHRIQKILIPKFQMTHYWQRLDYLKEQMCQRLQKTFVKNKHLLALLTGRLRAKQPGVSLERIRVRINQLENQLHKGLQTKISQYEQKLKSLSSTLHAVSPQATLDRGYAIVTHKEKVVYDPHHLQIGNSISIRLAKGSLASTVTALEAEKNDQT